MDQDFIKNELKSKLHTYLNIKDFVASFNKYEAVKEFERSDKSKKKTACHNSTQTNDIFPADVSIKDYQPLGIKSQ